MINNTYIPIDCNMYDVLLSKATLKKACFIVYKNEEHEQSSTAIIVDVYTKAKEEFMQLNNDIIIRLDKIVSVDGILVNIPLGSCPQLPFAKISKP
jgi:Rho-binding antiterminator